MQGTGTEPGTSLKPQGSGHTAQGHNDRGQWQNESTVHRANMVMVILFAKKIMEYVSAGA